MRDGFVYFRMLSRGNHDLRAIFAERFGNLEAQPPRPAGDEGPATLQIEQAFPGTVHAADSLIRLFTAHWRHQSRASKSAAAIGPPPEVATATFGSPPT